MQTDFYRIKRLPPYVIEEVNVLKAQARAAGEDIIDFSMGNPDMPTPKHIVDKLIETARDPRFQSLLRQPRHSRVCEKPIPRSTSAASASKVRLAGEVIANIGSKEGLRQSRPGDHRTRRVLLVPTRLSDPRFRLHPAVRPPAMRSCMPSPPRNARKGECAEYNSLAAP